MMLNTIQTTIGGKTLVDIALSRITEHEPPEGYYVAFSGGKDSIVVLDLVQRAGVKYDAHYSQTTVDPPEVTHYIKANYPEVTWEKPKVSMFKLIEKKGMLPTRQIRFCCSELKEIGGKGRTVVTGIRWEESRFRANRRVFEESKRVKGRFFLNPIIDWTTDDVWSYIRSQGMPYCSLYDEGKRRIGCIMCPMQGEKGMRQDAERYPKYYQAYRRAVQRVLDRGNRKSLPWGWGGHSRRGYGVVDYGRAAKEGLIGVDVKMYLIGGKDVWHKIIQQTGRQSPSTDPERVLPASAGSAGREGLYRSITKSGRSGTPVGSALSADTPLTGQTYKNNPFCKIPLTDAGRQHIANQLNATV